MSDLKRHLLGTAALIVLAGGGNAAVGGSATAQDAGLTGKIPRLEAAMQDQARRLSEQDKLLAEQRMMLDQQRRELDALKAMAYGDLDDARATGPVPAAVRNGPILLAQAVPLTGPVGEAPPAPERVEVAALPEGSGVLTQRGKFVLEPSIDYTHGSSNRLVFRGIEIVTGVQIGVIEASDADRNAVSGALAARYGLTNRIEIEMRAPYISRSDRITTLVQMEEAATRTFDLNGANIGDAEASVRYQINRGANGWPIFIGNLRVKSDTGTSPFDIERDRFGISTELATGSGFWAVEPSVSFLYPTDPAVVFGGISYLAHLPKDINRTIGEVRVGQVDPGDSIGVSAGFGFALNPRFSFSLGYKHNYIFPTKTELGPTMQKSEALQVGAFTFGWSFRLSEKLTIANSYEIGTTTDSPDMRVTFRLPIRF